MRQSASNSASEWWGSVTFDPSLIASSSKSVVFDDYDGLGSPGSRRVSLPDSCGNPYGRDAFLRPGATTLSHYACIPQPSVVSVFVYRPSKAHGDIDLAVSFFKKLPLEDIPTKNIFVNDTV